mgnify:FL=1
MKKILLLFTLIFSLGLLNITTSYASSLPIYDETYNNNQGAIYANGTPIIVSEENGKTVVSWENGSQIVPNSVTIFGGGNGGNFASSIITMNGGTVQNLVGGGIGFTEENPSFVSNTKIIINGGNVTNAIVGGGYFYSTVDTSNVEINGGNIFSVQGGAIATGKISGKNYSVGTKDDAINSKCRVNTANTIVNDGTIQSLLFGGGQGYSYTGTANLTINDGDMSKAYVTAGGSNGYTGNCTVKINGGSIYLYQSVNRGTVESAHVELSSGSIDKFYVGGETEDSTVTGVIDTVNTNLIGGNIGSLNAGTSNSSVISIDNDNFKVVSTDEVKITNDTIENSKIKIDYDFDISDDNLVLFINQSKKLDLNIKTIPENYEGVFDDVISYNCQNSDIARVNDDGVVTGISKGNTVIEVKVGNKMKTVNVEVKDFELLVIAGIAMLILYVVILFLIFGVFVPIW